jgi:Flp pilus assembly protein TadD
MLALSPLDGACQSGAGSAFQQRFKAALEQYQTGHFTQAAAALEALRQQAPRSFDVQELLGMAYAAAGQDAKAVAALRSAAQMMPGVPEAHTNLAASLAKTGATAQAGEEFQKALALEPGNYTANHNLAEFYLQTSKVAQALPLLETAQKLNPAADDNGYDLALAYFLAGRNEDARRQIAALLARADSGELHNLLAQVEEKQADFVAAGNEFGIAAHLDPTESNLFDWGSELLLHRAYGPAADVFQQASIRYPASMRLVIGLGIAYYSRSQYDEAVKTLLAAADMNPADSRCYPFLARAYESSPTQNEAVVDRFKRYAALQPKNAKAQYLYAVSLLAKVRGDGSGASTVEIETLLKRALVLDSSFVDAYVTLGKIYADRHDYALSIPEYEHALALNPNLSDAHYRLATDYVHTGQKNRAQTEIALYQKLREQHLAELDKEKAEVQQFVVSAKDTHEGQP